MSIDTQRHITIFDPSQHKLPIHIIGAGATGSHITYALAKLGFEDVTVWDFDIVEAHNVANQLYGLEDVGKPKVVALQNYIKRATNVEIKIKNEPCTENSKLAGIIFLLTDTMVSRGEIWKTIKLNFDVNLMVETRMGASSGIIHALNPNVIELCKCWEGTLFSDDKGERSACGGRISVGPTAITLTGYAVWSMIQHLNGNGKNVVAFDIPTFSLNAFNWKS